MKLISTLSSFLCAFLCFSLSGITFCLESKNNDQSNGLHLTIYSTIDKNTNPFDLYQSLQIPNPGNSSIPGFAIIRQQKKFEIKESQQKIRLSPIPLMIDPSTVILKSLTDPDKTSVMEQDYRFDLSNQQKLLAAYLGQEITVEQEVGNKIENFTGKLLNFSGAIILQDKDNKILSINNYANIRFPMFAENRNFATEPTLIWDVVTKKPGLHDMEISFQTKGITWFANYNAIFKEAADSNKANTGFLDLNAWVTILNQTGANYENANINLMAGEVGSLVNQEENRAVAYKGMLSQAASTPSISEKTLFEYHMYTLDKKTSLPDNSIKQIELFPTISKIPVEKQYIFAGTNQQYYGGINLNKDLEQSNTKVDVYLKFKNNKKFGLGMPLPMGRIRISQLDTQQKSLEFIGEDSIDHKAQDEEIRIRLGSAFDITGERKQINFKLDNNRHVMEETIEVIIKNHKNQDVDIVVKENLYRGMNWQIVESTLQYEKVNGQAVNFPIEVKKESDGKFRYTVRYTW